MKWLSLALIMLSISACDSSQVQSVSTAQQSASLNSCSECTTPVVSPSPTPSISPTPSPSPSPDPTTSCIPISQPITFNGTYENVPALPPARPSIMAGILPWDPYRAHGSLSIGAPQGTPGITYVSHDMNYLLHPAGNISVTVSQTSALTWIYGTIILSSEEQADIENRVHGDTCVTGVSLEGVLESSNLIPDYRSSPAYQGSAYLFFGDQTEYVPVSFIGQP